ncbi:cAMP-specific 3',5'-cyclic phosphodiesterase 4D [Ictalurus furcatus]|uniref:cAMP-specific 3',5'-cyclic phosphodiesterase 4D n=1 Tax=Ictalurus furcatus TaxID=66913 RepID=UPI0023508633|nr:cAMP-specific 3',5'-cyclic phosphodiesterase 4D [Ictalurus furcatus]
MQENTYSGESQMESVSDSSLSPDGCPLTCMEPFTVRRLSCRSVQLPPLAFRQAEQYYCERRPETETAQPRPTSLPLRAPPLIAITSAENSNRWIPSFPMSSCLLIPL